MIFEVEIIILIAFLNFFTQFDDVVMALFWRDI